MFRHFSGVFSWFSRLTVTVRGPLGDLGAVAVVFGRLPPFFCCLCVWFVFFFCCLGAGRQGMNALHALSVGNKGNECSHVPWPSVFFVLFLFLVFVVFVVFFVCLPQHLGWKGGRRWLRLVSLGWA